MPDTKKIQQLDFNLLKVFHTLYLEQNMTRTAEILHVTPSAVSHAIKRLREVLDDPLFRRSQNKMLPSPACQRMAPAIIETLTRLQQILQQWGEFNPLRSDHNFTIGMHDAVEPSVLPALATTLAKQAPHVTFCSVQVNRSNLGKDLASGHIDIALDVAFPVKRPVRHMVLFENEFVVMMRKGHPLAAGLNRENYLVADHLIVSNRPSGMTVEDILIQDKNLVRQTTIRCQNYFAAKELLKNSDQLLTIPMLVARQFRETDLLVQDMPLKLPGFATHMYWHENSQDDAALSWLRKVIADLLSN
ncbi:MAG: LysR family transcriptional regulator [Gammaproteobacteria bacterium]|nr:LysR family transcriptional regulator [Gammaproteobacteria bacterium]